MTRAVQRFDDRRMLTAELGDPVRARLVRLVGDGLFLAALTGEPPTSDEVEHLLHHLGLPAAAGS